MKTKQVIGIIVAIVGVVAIVAFAMDGSSIGSRIGTIGGIALTAFGALYPFIFKEKQQQQQQQQPVLLTKEVARVLADPVIIAENERLQQQVAELEREKLQRDLAQPNLPDYKKAVKPYVAKGDYAKAIELVNPGGAAKEAAEKYIFTAQLYIANYQFKEAEEHYKKAIEIFPSDDNTFAAAVFYYSLNRFNEAKEYFNRCLSMELSPAQRAVVQNNLGLIFEQLNDYPEAEKAFAEALEIY
ncbi:MAG: tetratricopeptide repeat protein, partial [Tannerellaceae bacterium]|nr:tetratricopeptide repeat protein [Tannerellaceae bacterium]